MSKRNDILNATRNLIFEQGLQSVSMSQIAKAANVGMGTIYNYFPTKEDLVNELFSILAKSMSDASLLNYDDTMPIPTRLKGLCSNLLGYGLQNQRDMLLFEQLNHSPYIRDEVQNHDYGVKAAFFTVLEEAQAADVVKNLPPILLGNVLISYVAAILRSRSQNNIDLTPEIIQNATEAWYDLIKKS